MIPQKQAPGSSLNAAFSRTLAIAGALAAACMLGGCGAGAGSALSNGAPTGNTGTAYAVPNGPQLGYVWRSSDKTLRPILGVLGSSQIGESVTASGEFVAGSASPVGGVGVLVGSDGALSTMSLPAGALNALNVSVSPTATIRFAPSAGSALVFSPGSTVAALISGLPGAAIARLLTLNAAVTDAAVSDKGTIAVAMSAGGGAVVAMISSNGATQQIARVGQVGGMSFVPGTDDLLLTDSTANSLLRISSASTSPMMAVLPTANLLNAPGGIGISKDGTWAVIANKGAANVVQLSLAAGSAPQAIACNCQPTLVAPLAGGHAFRFTDLASGPLWMADIAAANPKLMFVPALH